MIEDITMNTIVFVGQVMNPLLQGSPVVSSPPVNTQTPIKCKFIILNFKNDKLQFFSLEEIFDPFKIFLLCNRVYKKNMIFSSFIINRTH